MPNAKSIIIAGIYIGGVTMPEWKNPWYGRTSRLYLSEFFLDVVKPLVPISDFLETVGYQAITGISYDLFHRNVLIAMERAEKLTERTYQ